MPKPGDPPSSLSSTYGPRPPVPIPPIHTILEEPPPSLDTLSSCPEDLPSPKKFSSLLQIVKEQYLHELTFWTTTVRSLRSQLQEEHGQCLGQTGTPVRPSSSHLEGDQVQSCGQARSQCRPSAIESIGDNALLFGQMGTPVQPILSHLEGDRAQSVGQARFQCRSSPTQFSGDHALFVGHSGSSLRPLPSQLEREYAQSVSHTGSRIANAQSDRSSSDSRAALRFISHSVIFSDTHTTGRKECSTSNILENGVSERVARHTCKFQEQKFQEQNSPVVCRNRTLNTLLSGSDKEQVRQTMKYNIQQRFIRVRNWCDESPPEEFVATILEPVMGILIVASCILTCVSLDTENSEVWYVVDWIIVGLFTLELPVRLKILGWRDFLFIPALGWSVFDILLVILAIVDVVARFSGAIVMDRVLRLLRLSRLVRLMRVPALKELVMLINGLVGGARCLLWCMCFLALPVSLTGMFLSQVLKDWDEEGLFSTVPTAMFTTLRCMCGDCTDLHGRPIFVLIAKKRGWYFALFYSFLKLLTILGLFNLMTAIFLESTMHAAKSDPLLQLQLRKADDQKFAENVRKLVFRLWLEHSDKNKREQRSSRRYSVHSKEFLNFNLVDALDLEIDQDFYQKLVHKPEIREILDDMGMHDDDIVDLFDMLDVDGSGTLDLSELVNGLHKLRGDARKSDLVALAYMIYSVQDNVRELNTRIVRLGEKDGTIFERQRS